MAIAFNDASLRYTLMTQGHYISASHANILHALIEARMVERQVRSVVVEHEIIFSGDREVNVDLLVEVDEFNNMKRVIVRKVG